MSIFFGSVGPDDFSKNYANWARKFGLTEWADWLSLYATAPRVFWSAILISFVYLMIAFIIPMLVKQTKRDVAVVAVPIVVALVVAVAVFGQYAIGNSAERHISEYQRKKLNEILSPVAVNFPRALAVGAVLDPEADAYAIELMTALALTGLKVASINNKMLAPLNIRALSPHVQGVFFQVRDPGNPPNEVKTLVDALEKSGIRVRYANNVDFPESDYALSVGLR